MAILPMLVTTHKNDRERAAPRIGLALSGGGARGFAHLGALRVFERAGIKFDAISGTSIGALLGAGYCSGIRPCEMIEITKSELMPARRWPGSNFWHLRRLVRNGLIRAQLERRFSSFPFLRHLPQPLYLVSTDLATGQPYIHEGNDETIPSVLASLTVPGVAPPVRYRNKLLVDGGVVMNLPGKVLRRYGIDFVVAIDVCSYTNRPQSKPFEGNRLAALWRTWQARRYQARTLQDYAVDLHIRPEISQIGPLDFHCIDGLITAGEEAARAALPRLLSLFHGRSVEHYLTIQRPLHRFEPFCAA